MATSGETKGIGWSFRRIILHELTRNVELDAGPLVALPLQHLPLLDFLREANSLKAGQWSVCVEEDADPREVHPSSTTTVRLSLPRRGSRVLSLHFLCMHRRSVGLVSINIRSETRKSATHKLLRTRGYSIASASAAGFGPCKAGVTCQEGPRSIWKPSIRHTGVRKRPNHGGWSWAGCTSSHVSRWWNPCKSRCQ